MFNLNKNKRHKKKKVYNDSKKFWEEEYFGFEFIVGYTSGGVPYCITK